MDRSGEHQQHKRPLHPPSPSPPARMQRRINSRTQRDRNPSMASVSRKSPSMQLYEANPAEPKPLRIIKRGQYPQAVASSTTSRTSVFPRGRNYSKGSSTGPGSPPGQTDRPLTVHKIRKDRKSILDFSLDEGPQELSHDAISEMIRQSDVSPEYFDDPDNTPKARRRSRRVASPGQYLATELNQYNPEVDLGFSSPDANRESINSLAPDLIPQRAYNVDGSPKTQRRNKKNFLLKALAGRRSVDSKRSKRSIRLTSILSTKTVNSQTTANTDKTRDTVLQRYSRRWSQSGNDGSEFDEQLTDTLSSNGSNDIANVRFSSRFSGDMPGTPSLASFVPNEKFVLCPQINITPELDSIDENKCILWVAIEITGILRKADGSKTERPVRFPSYSSNATLNDLARYGSMHSMRVETKVGSGCMITEVIGNLHEKKTVRAGETQLILVKLRINSSKNSNAIEHVRQNSDECFADLHDFLGNTLLSYLTVILTYRHSAFTDPENLMMDTRSGQLSQDTKLFTTAEAKIRRIVSSSEWTPRNSRSLHVSSISNPVVELIEAYLPTEEARLASAKIAGDRDRIPRAKRKDWSSEQSTADEYGSCIVDRVNSSVSMMMAGNGLPRMPRTPTSGISRAGTPSITPMKALPVSATVSGAEALGELDPARGYWRTTRKKSDTVDAKRHPRTSISAGNYFDAMEDHPLSPMNPNNISPRISSLQSSPSMFNLRGQDIENQRNRLRQEAIRNQRSVGQDTLRSLMPSPAKSKGGGSTGSTTNRLGLGNNKFPWFW